MTYILYHLRDNELKVHYEVTKFPCGQKCMLQFAVVVDDFITMYECEILNYRDSRYMYERSSQICWVNYPTARVRTCRVMDLVRAGSGLGLINIGSVSVRSGMCPTFNYPTHKYLPLLKMSVTENLGLLI